MSVRWTKMSDLSEILKIYAYAREEMKRGGNPSQWGNDRPSEAVIRRDIEEGDSYVLEEEGGIYGVFSFITGEEPTYRIIEEGGWKNDNPYGTIHRLAGNGTRRGVFRDCIAYCEQHMGDIRVDTHRDNLIMQHLLEKAGYEKCGIIHVEDGTPRIAYQKTVQNVDIRRSF